jgi:hypothetical protein
VIKRANVADRSPENNSTITGSDADSPPATQYLLPLNDLRDIPYPR